MVKLHDDSGGMKIRFITINTEDGSIMQGYQYREGLENDTNELDVMLTKHNSNSEGGDPFSNAVGHREDALIGIEENSEVEFFDISTDFGRALIDMVMQSMSITLNSGIKIEYCLDDEDLFADYLIHEEDGTISLPYRDM